MVNQGHSDIHTPFSALEADANGHIATLFLCIIEHR